MSRILRVDQTMSHQTGSMISEVVRVDRTSHLSGSVELELFLRFSIKRARQLLELGLGAHNL